MTGLFEVGQPGLDLGDAVAQLASEAEATGPAPTMAQVMDCLNRHAQMGGQFRGGQYGLQAGDQVYVCAESIMFPPCPGAENHV